MNTRRLWNSTGAAVGRRGLRPLGGALLRLLLGAGSTVPARAATVVINSASGPITIGPGENYVIVAGGSVTASGGHVAVIVNGGTLVVTDGSISGDIGIQVKSGTVKISGGSISTHGGAGVAVEGGTVSISGGSISAVGQGVAVEGGAVNISGGSISGDNNGVLVHFGTANITGGTISGTFYGVVVGGGSGTLNIYGCGLTQSSSNFSGTLLDGLPISGIVTSGTLNLINRWWVARAGNPVSPGRVEGAFLPTPGGLARG